LPTVSPDDISQTAAASGRLDDDVRCFIHHRMSYRWVETESGAEAFAPDSILVVEGLNGSLPYLNPRRVEAAQVPDHTIQDAGILEDG
jgi:hypothetical protein